MQLSLLSVPESFKRKLASHNLRSMGDILESLQLSLRKYNRTPSAKIVGRLEMEFPFISEHREEFIHFVTAHKLYLLELAFEAFSEKGSASVNFWETLDSETIDLDDESIGGTFDVDGVLPTKTLFIGCLPEIGGDYVSLEDALQPFESTVLASLQTFDISERNGTRKLLRLLANSEWPSDAPIFVSESAMLKYAKVVDLLSEKAALVVKSL